MCSKIESLVEMPEYGKKLKKDRISTWIKMADLSLKFNFLLVKNFSQLFPYCPSPLNFSCNNFFYV